MAKRKLETGAGVRLESRFRPPETGARERAEEAWAARGGAMDPLARASSSAGVRLASSTAMASRGRYASCSRRMTRRRSRWSRS